MTDLSRLPGVRFGAVARHADRRGAFREVWRDSTFAALTREETGAALGTEPRFIQANGSRSILLPSHMVRLPSARIRGCGSLNLFAAASEAMSHAPG